jgi:hypothetical protein
MLGMNLTKTKADKACRLRTRGLNKDEVHRQAVNRGGQAFEYQRAVRLTLVFGRPGLTTHSRSGRLGSWLGLKPLRSNVLVAHGPRGGWSSSALRLQTSIQVSWPFHWVALTPSAATPNPSFNRRANGRPPSPGRWYAVHFHRPGLGVLPSPPG